jgi:hypothetical protein
MIGLPDCVGTEMTIQDDLLDATAARGIIWYKLNYSYLYQPSARFLRSPFQKRSLLRGAGHGWPRFGLNH